MKIRGCYVKMITTLVVLLFINIVNTYAVVVKLDIKDTSGMTRASEYVSYGVPLSNNDAVTSTSGMKISTDVSGTGTVDAQFDVLSRYNSTPDGSGNIRIVLCTFAVDVPANSSATYYLHTSGGAGNVVSKDLASSDSSRVIIDTGNLLAEIKKTAGFNLFNRVSVDSIDLVSNPLSDGIIVASDESGSTKVYTSYNDKDAPTVKIERNGPLKCIVSVEGYLEDASNNQFKPAEAGAEPVKYKVWYTAFKNQRWINTKVTIKNENRGYAGMPGLEPMQNVDIDYLYVKTTLQGLNKISEVGFDGFKDSTDPAGSYAVRQEWASNGQAEINNFSYVINEDGVTKAKGSTYDSYADIRDTLRGLSVASRWFYQNFPKEIQIDASSKEVKFYLWPDEPNDHVFLGGIWKTHEILYDFHGQTTNYAAELNQLKNPLAIYANNWPTADAIDIIAPGQITTSAVGGDKQPIQPAIDAYNASIRAKFDSKYANTSMNADFKDWRENAYLTWTEGVYQGKRITQNGWLDFGDWIRNATLGFWSQNYSWGYVAGMNALRFEDNNMMEESAIMARHYGDILIIHDPDGDVDKKSCTNATEAQVHGGQRPEWDAHMQRGKWEYSFGGDNEPNAYDHAWPKGLFLQYLLTGDPLYLDVIKHIGQHTLYMYSNFPAHETQTDSYYICNEGDSCYKNHYNSRAYTRAIHVALDLWKITGNKYYLETAKGIFTRAVLVNEVSNKGYLAFNSGSPSDAHMLYEALSIKPLILLYYECVLTGDTTTANNVKNYLVRKAKWMRDEVYTKWTDGHSSGEINGDYYMPYETKLNWEPLATWTYADSKEVDISYSFVHADLFAFLYAEGEGSEWMDLANAVFRDGLIYKGTASQEPIFKGTSLADIRIDGWATSSMQLKMGKMFHKPMFYLNEVWKESQKNLEMVGQKPSSPTNLRISTE